MADNVNHPDHYNNGSVECIEALKSALSPQEFIGFCKGNALKYIWRANHKGGMEDIDKARWYLNTLEDFCMSTGKKLTDEIEKVFVMPGFGNIMGNGGKQ